MTYCRLCCDINGPDFDPCIEHVGSTSFLYCIQFPNHLYDPSTHVLLDARTPVSKEKNRSTGSGIAFDLIVEAASMATPLNDGLSNSPTNERNTAST